tara:strand:+ start:605 stop:796 length:192 start_codon:yes stop_codon:yes gene_type:complete
MKVLLWLVIAWNSIDLIGKLILSFTDHENIAFALGSFIDASIYSVSLIILTVFTLKLIGKFKM